MRKYVPANTLFLLLIAYAAMVSAFVAVLHSMIDESRVVLCLMLLGSFRVMVILPTHI